jgi:hypothetical protein
MGGYPGAAVGGLGARLLPPLSAPAPEAGRGGVQTLVPSAAPALKPLSRALVVSAPMIGSKLLSEAGGGEVALPAPPPPAKAEADREDTADAEVLLLRLDAPEPEPEAEEAELDPALPLAPAPAPGGEEELLPI